MSELDGSQVIRVAMVTCTECGDLMGIGIFEGKIYFACSRCSILGEKLSRDGYLITLLREKDARQN